jgi:sortase (surface protein transpeptidase)
MALLAGLMLALATIAAFLGAEDRHDPIASKATTSAASRSSSAVESQEPSVSPPASSSARSGTSGTAHRRPQVTGIRPVHVRIPAIDVAASVIDLGLNDDGTLEVPETFDEAGWWTGGAKPGADGPAVVVGHVDSRAGPGVFYRLGDVDRGDRIGLRDRRGRVVRFLVDRVEQHPKDDFPTDAVYGDTEQPTLRLITCGGAFNQSARSYVDNVIVYASLAG